MSPTDPLFRAPGFPKTLYRGRPTTITGRRFESEQQRVRNADEETRAKAAGWVENEQVAIDAATRAHWAQEDATNRAQWAQQAAATRAHREQQDQARHAADRHHADLIEQAVAKALGRHQETRQGSRLERFPKRAAWLKALIDGQGWTKNYIKNQGGPDHGTIDKILNAQPVTEPVLNRLAKALSIARDQIPNG